MRLPILWETTNACRSEQHCSACRAQTPAGQKFRASVHASFVVPGDEVDFACPASRGSKPWNYLLPIERSEVCACGSYCQRCRQPEAGREWRREIRKRYIVPGNIVDFPCPLGKKWLSASGERDERRHVLIQNYQGAGDAVVLTSAIRDLHVAYPHRFVTSVRSSRIELFAHNEYVTPEGRSHGKLIQVHVNPGSYRRQKGHLSDEFHAILGAHLGVHIPTMARAGHVRLCQEEQKYPTDLLPPSVAYLPYCVAWFGGKHDFTVKWWPQAHMQRVIDAFRGRLNFVRMGAGGWQPPLSGTVDMRGRTSHRAVARLVYHARIGIGPVSYGMHLSAALPMPDGNVRPFIVLGGGAESPNLYAYEGHTVLHTIGKLPCCESRGCWHFKAERRGTPVAVPDCENVVPPPGGDADPSEYYYAKCMTMVTADMVIDAIERALVAEPIRAYEPPPTPPRLTGAERLAQHWRELGPRLWFQLHYRTVYGGSGINNELASIDAEAERTWLARFSQCIPCGDCRQHWHDLLDRVPPVYTDRSSYFRWSVDVHNAVNVRLKKPVVSAEQARAELERKIIRHERARATSSRSGGAVTPVRVVG